VADELGYVQGVEQGLGIGVDAGLSVGDGFCPGPDGSVGTGSSGVAVGSSP
jgi:hypothetical protein